MKRRMWLLAEIACALLLAVCLGIMLRDGMLRSRMRREEAQAGMLLAGESVFADEQREIFDYFLPLLEENPQTVGLVGVGDKAMYVCQAEDNRYYMNHRFDGSEDEAGMIFLDARCCVSPQSGNMILYGHNRRDGSRFGTLKRYLEAEYLLRHPTIRFATLYELYDYMPVAVILTTVDETKENYFDWVRTDFADSEDFESFICEAQCRSELELSVEVEWGTPLLTLVTCSGEGADGRLVLICARKNSMDSN